MATMPLETFIKFEDGEEIGDNDEELPLGSVNLAWNVRLRGWRL